MPTNLNTYTLTLGMRTSAKFSSDRRVGSWREGILIEEPNGDYPLTGLSSQFPKEKLVGDVRWNYWTEAIPKQKGAITEIYTDQALGTAVADGNSVEGEMIYVKMSAADAKEFVPNDTVRFECSTDFYVTTRARVLERQINGENSYVCVKLLEDDDNTTTAKDLRDADYLSIYGSAFPEGAGVGEMVDSEPIKVTNQAQIFQTPFKVTRSAKKVALRGSKNVWMEKMERARKRHFMKLEKAIIWSKYAIENEGTDEEIRYTWGLIPFIEEYASDNIFDYTQDAAYSGKTWAEGGHQWLRNCFKQIFKYGGRNRMALTGTGAIVGLQELAELYSGYILTPATTKFGLGVLEWVTAFGTIVPKIHPLFSHDDVTNNMMVLFEPGEIRQRIVDDTFIKKDNPKAGGQHSIDGTVDVFITELGFEFKKVSGWGILLGVGQNNVV